MGDMVYQKNGLCPNILDRICSWKILKMIDFMFSQAGGTPHFVIFQGGVTGG